MPQEEYLKQQINQQYGSVAKFAEAVGIPQTTIRNIFTRGIDGVGTATMVRICDALNLDVSALMRNQPQKQLDLDDFTYAMFQETQDLPEEKKQMLLEMARFFKRELQQKTEEN